MVDDHNYVFSIPEESRTAIRHAAWIMLTVLGLVVALTANAANPASDAQARYAQERAACFNGQSNQDRATCLKEAGAALQEARAGHLADRQQDYAANAMRRCEALPGDQRDMCERRVNGEGTVTGSVREGGVFHELTVVDKPAQMSDPVVKK
jgi:cytochrome c1